MLTVVTMPSIGEVSVASLIWSIRSSRVFVAFETCVSALYTPIRVCRIAAVVVAADRFVLAIASWILAVLSAVVASA